MWQLDNRSPFAAAGSWIRDPEGREIWIVAVKATYDIDPRGRTRPADLQPPVAHGPVTDDNGTLVTETDLGPAKLATDVILLGHAHAPAAKPVTTLDIGFRVGELIREARVFGNRRWVRSLAWVKPSPPEPFERMPLTWSRAFGGFDPKTGEALPNPDGCGVVSDGAACALPNVEHHIQRLKLPWDRPPAVGFGPVPRHWPARMRYAGTYDEAWRRSRHPLLPADLDPRHWQTAPPEQQYPGRLRGGEPVGLIHLTPPGFGHEGLLQFPLPKLSLGFETWFYDGTRQRSRSTIHTVILEPDYPRVSIVHHMALPCHPKVNLLDRTIITVKHRPLDQPEPQQ